MIRVCRDIFQGSPKVHPPLHCDKELEVAFRFAVGVLEDALVVPLLLLAALLDAQDDGVVLRAIGVRLIPGFHVQIFETLVELTKRDLICYKLIMSSKFYKIRKQ